MSLLYTINYAIFAMFLCLFTIEAGIGVLTLVAYGSYRSSIRKYLLPIWGMDGTFGVFYFVNLIATYPKLSAVIYAYIVPVMLGAIFFLLRNAFVSYSEYIGEIKLERLCMRIYGVSTIIMVFIVISVFTSGLTGTGVILSQDSVTLNLLSLFFNPFNIMIFFAIVLISLFIVGSYFKLEILTDLSYTLLPLSMILFLLAFYWYAPSLFASAIKNYDLLLASIILMLIAIVLESRRSRLARYAALVWIFFSINLFGAIQYPYFMGGQLQFTNYLTNSAGASAIVSLTTVCGAFLIVAIAIFVYISYLKKY